MPSLADAGEAAGMEVSGPARRSPGETVLLLSSPLLLATPQLPSGRRPMPARKLAMADAHGR